MSSDAIVHVVDDDEAVRHSLEFLLATVAIKVRTYESAEAFLKNLPHFEPGCVITDIRMSGLSGLDLMKRLKEYGMSIPVIAITGHGDVPLAVEAMKCGAIDFLEKPFDDETLLAAVRSALNQHKHQDTRDAERADIIERLQSLSNRERQVLDGLIQGHPNKTIGFDLGISARTVEIYRANVMTKMRASSLSDLVRMALVAGVSEFSESGGKSAP
jgi:two-component system, LuxR family, response regulator FixJ